MKTTEKCCGNCTMYINEDMNGVGWCDFHQEPFDCDEVCDDYFVINGIEDENG